LLTIALATGACNVEAVDSLIGIPSWELFQKRISSGLQKTFADILG
jgi:hypothetical protein